MVDNFNNINNEDNVELQDIYSYQQEPNNESDLSSDWNDQTFLSW